MTYHSYKVKEISIEKNNEELKERYKEQTISKKMASPSKLELFTSNISYPTIPNVGDPVGQLEIPKLKVSLPIIEAANPDQLAKGVGHFHESVLPGKRDNCILSGHRDTVFRHLGELNIGDNVITKTDAGTFVYSIKKIRVVNNSDRTVIVPTRLPTLTLTTCYPFRFIGNAQNVILSSRTFNPQKAKLVDLAFKELALKMESFFMLMFGVTYHQE